VAVFEYRHYEIVSGGMALTRRYFREVNEPNMARHGFTLLGPWEVVAGTTNTLHYLLQWADFDERERAWASFFADPDYQAGRAEIMKDGELALRAHVQFWRPMPDPA
jgi:hypothetical protein